MMPKRIQRQRTKGWHMPPNTVYVGRPTEWGNPFDWRKGVEIGGEAWARGAAVELYRRWLALLEPSPEMRRPPRMPDEIRAALRGKDLACWCPLDQPCHADVLLEIANR